MTVIKNPAGAFIRKPGPAQEASLQLRRPRTYSAAKFDRRHSIYPAAGHFIGRISADSPP
jgi:hypothetical protein